MGKVYPTNALRQSAYRRRKKVKDWTVAPGCGLRNVTVGSRDRGEIPVLRYFGGKHRLAPWVISKFPAHKTYVEPFAGGAAVLLRKSVSRWEALSDVDQRVINFWIQLRNDPSWFVTALQGLQWSREVYKSACNAPLDEVGRQAALNFYIRNWLSFGSGSGRWASGFRNGKPGVERNFLDPSKFLDAANRLTDVMIGERTALSALTAYDSPDTLFYLDPPYLPSTRQKIWDYRHEMTHDDHVTLLQKITSLTGMVIISGYKSELYCNALAGWQYFEKSVSTRGSSRIESLWLSPNCDLDTRLGDAQ